MNRRRSLAVTLALGATLATAAAQAQAPSAALNRFTPAETPEDDFQLSRPSDFGHLRFGAQLHLDYALNPLVYETMLGDPSSESLAVIEHQLGATVGLAFGLFDRVVIFAGLPVVLLMDGASAGSVTAVGGAPADGAGLGDLYFGGRVRLVGEASDVGALSVQLSGTAPTGAYEDQSYRSEDFVTFLPELLAELRPGFGSRIVMNLGVRVRNEEASEESNLAFSHELTYGLGFAIPMWTAEEDRRTHLDLAVQAYGATALAFGDQREGTSIEAIAGLRVFHASGVVAGLAAGPGLTRGLGSPDLRVVAQLGWMIPEELEPVAEGDRDLDGLVDSQDRCPDEPEDRDAWQDEDGCPDPDNDGDGILDAADQCRNEPETVNEHEDTDGCPDEVPDTDGDGLRDDVDECDDQPEDVDSWQDEDGCPEPDNDEDGILDTADRCPNEAGPVENQGCPDADRDGDTVVDRLDNCPDEPGPPENRGCREEQQVVIESNRIDILDAVYFRTNGDQILARSHALLLNVARVLNVHPEITRISVEGHTDSRGRREHNLALSQRRAEAVVRFLVEEGDVSAERLEAHGYGPDRPVVENARTRTEHAQNRRVEFNIPEAAGVEQRAAGADEETIDR